MAALIDLTGQRFGRLSVLERAGNDSHGQAQRVAVCACGTTKTVAGAQLRSGKTRSCGCLARHGRTVDLSGNVYGRLTALEVGAPFWTGSQFSARWSCLCSCGTAVVVRASALRGGTTKSCGCLKRESAARRMAVMRRGNWKGDVMGYGRAHELLREERGPASGHPCADCGGPAAEWSLRRGAPVTYPKDPARPDFYRYSLDPDDYEPRCVRDHRNYDTEPQRAAYDAESPADRRRYLNRASYHRRRNAA